MNGASLRSCLTIAVVGVVVASLALLGFFYLISSPRQWSTQAPGQSDFSVRVEGQELGFVDDHYRTSVFVEYDPWFSMASEEEIATFDSLSGGPYQPTGFTFDWITDDSLLIYSRTADEKRLMTIVIPSQRRALQKELIEQLRRTQEL